MAEAVEVVKEAFVQLSFKQAQAPLRTSLNLEAQGEVALIMPAYISRTKALGTKMITVLPQNPRTSLPAVQGLVVLFDASRGFPLGHLGRHPFNPFPHRSSHRCGHAGLIPHGFKKFGSLRFWRPIFFQIKGVLAARRIERIKIFDLLPESVDSLMGRLRKDPLSREVELCQASSPAQSLEGADTVVTATKSTQPVFEGRLLEEGAHINTIGAYKPEMQEVDEETIRRSKIFVDSAEAWGRGRGPDHSFKEGRNSEKRHSRGTRRSHRREKPGRGASREITCFKSVGNAVQDVSVAQAIFQRSR